MECSSQMISEMLPEIHTLEKFDFLKKYNPFSNNFILCLVWSSDLLLFLIGVSNSVSFRGLIPFHMCRTVCTLFISIILMFCRNVLLP